MATLFVDLNATGSNDGSAWNNAYTDLQAAIAAAQDGDQIWVADGTYKPTAGQDRSISFQLKSSVEIYGGFAGGEENLDARDIENNQTILSGDLGVADDNSDNSYHVVEASNTNSEAILDGFFITAGNADGEGDFSNGGGINAIQGQAMFQNLQIFNNNTEGEGGGFYSGDLSSLDEISNHQLTNVVFQNNTANLDGGGISIDHGVLILNNVEFLNNVGSRTGGGINNGGSITITNGSFIGNSTNVGGGAITDGNLTLTDVEFIDNTAEQGGGAIETGISSNSYDFNNVSFTGNTAEYGGAIYVSGLEEPLKINNTSFNSNSATEQGGAIYVDPLFSANPEVTNSVFNGNNAPLGGAVYVENNNATIINSTFANNQADNGAGIYSLLEGEERPTVTNSIIYGNQGNAIANEGGTTVVNNSIVQGGYAGDGNLDTDPLFLDAENGDLRIIGDSPGIDVGNNELVADEDPTNPPLDIAGNPRIFNNTVDLGAYELNESSLNEELVPGGEAADDSASSEDGAVYRFINNDLQLQFYTASEEEKDFVVENLPNYELEGVSFIAAPDPAEQDITGVSPVYRLFNPALGIHLYTISEAEKDFVVENLPNYTLEGVGYYGYDTQQAGTIPLYRFFNPSLGAHFYTPSAEERDFFLNSPDYQPEGGGDGIAFYIEPAADAI